MTARPWNDVHFYFSGDSYFGSILKNIQKAVSEIRIEIYMFNFDELGRAILENLKEARLRGVEVYLLVDAIGSLGFVGLIEEYCEKHGIHFKVYHPLPLKTRLLNRFFLMFSKINKRDHRKIFLIDQKTAFIGSQNVNKIHCESYVSGRAWRDTGVQVSGGAIKEIENLCRMSWEKVRTNRSQKQHLRGLLQSFQKAEKRIWITTAYFLPNRRTLKALIKASRRGVNVRICLPAVSDMPFMKWTAWLLYDRLLNAGVQIFEYQNRILHAKSLIIDHWATVGSYNFNHRSLIHDLEIEVLLDQPEWVNVLEKQWDIDLSQSKRISLQDRGHHNIFLRFIANIFYWFRYWL